MSITLPQPLEVWLAGADRLNLIGETLLEVAGTALDVLGSGDRYQRRVLAHGTLVPVEPGEGGQLAVCCSQVFLGRAGEQQYQFDHGSPGRFGFRSATFPVRVTRPYPIRQGDQPLAVPAIDDARELLWRDALVVHGALLALSLGGVQGAAWTPGVSEMIVGAMQAPDPSGGQASWVCDVTCQIT